MQEYSARTRRGEGLSWLSAGSQLYAACLRWYLASTSGGDVSATSLHRVGRETVASILSRIDKVFVTPTPIGERSIVMSVSVCLSVYVFVRYKIFETVPPIVTNFFVHVTYSRGSILIWRRSDILCTSGFMDDVMLAHKPRLLDVTAQLKRTTHAALGLAINCAQ